MCHPLSGNINSEITLHNVFFSFCLHQHAAAGTAGPRGWSQTAFTGYWEAQRREQHSERGAAETEKGLLVFVCSVFFLLKAHLGTCSTCVTAFIWILGMPSFTKYSDFTRNFDWVGLRQNMSTESIINTAARKKMLILFNITVVYLFDLKWLQLPKVDLSEVRLTCVFS